MNERLQLGMVIAGAVFNSAAVWLLFRQAMAGQPLIGQAGRVFAPFDQADA